jgi:bifunctional non-homologous end joining protein LigD
VRLYSRNGHLWTGPFFDTAARALRDVPAGTILDGELIAIEPATGNVSFPHVMRRQGQPSFVAFDVLAIGGELITAESWQHRRGRLDAIASRSGIPLVPTFDDGHQLLAACPDHRIEGVVSKLRDAPYRSGPTSSWIKCKCPVWLATNTGRWSTFVRPSRRPPGLYARTV